jgi:hypothetical protein
MPVEKKRQVSYHLYKKNLSFKMKDGLTTEAASYHSQQDESDRIDRKVRKGMDDPRRIKRIASFIQPIKDIAGDYQRQQKQHIERKIEQTGHQGDMIQCECDRTENDREAAGRMFLQDQKRKAAKEEFFDERIDERYIDRDI